MKWKEYLHLYQSRAFSLEHVQLAAPIHVFSSGRQLNLTSLDESVQVNYYRTKL